MTPKVLLLQQSSIFEQYGGIEYYLDDFCKAFQNSFGKESLFVISPSRTKSSEKPGFYPLAQVQYPKNALWLKVNNRIPLRLYQKAKRIIQEFKPDFLLCGHKALSPLVYLLSRKFGIPYGTFAYGIEVWGKSFWHEDLTFLNSDFLISISHFTKSQIPQFKKQTFILHPCVPKEFETLVPTPKKQSPFQILTVSRLSQREAYKGHREVLTALAYLKQNGKLPLDVKYTILGKGDDRKNLETLTKHLELSSHVQFIESVPTRKNLIEAYQNHHVFVMPSSFERDSKSGKGEGFGIVYAEAMACETPCIAYHSGGALDIIEDQRTGFLVHQGDTRQLAHRILAYYSDRDLLDHHGKASYQHIQKEFVFSKFQQNVETLFSGMQNLLKDTQRTHSHDIGVELGVDNRLQSHN